MTRHVARIMMTAMWLAASASVVAQRDGAGPPREGDGIISGQIVTAGLPPQPVGRAIVALAGGPVERTVIADDDGRFLFEALPPGRYTVRLRKAAWLETAYGATRPGGTGTPIALAAGQRREIALTMLYGGVIEGRVTLPSGAPATRISVRVAPVGPTGSLRGVDAAIADDQGKYRIYGIPPGEYVVQASPPVIPAMMLALYRPADQEVDAALARLNDRTQPRRPGTAAPVAVGSVLPSHQIVYAAVFYPGVASRGDATPISLAAAEERVGVDFVFTSTPMSRVAGHVTGPLPSLAGAQVRFQARGERAATTVAVAADGVFAAPALVPGVYDVIARLDPENRATGTNDPQRIVMASAVAVDTSSANTLWAHSDVTVVGQDIDGLQLTLVPGSTMRGRVRFSELPAATALNGVTVHLSPVSMGVAIPVALPGGFATTRNVMASADGRFEVRGLAPGTYRMSVTIPTPLATVGWWARSALADGADLLDTGLEVTSGRDVGDVDLVLSKGHGSLAGQLRLTDGHPGSDYFVIAFSTDRRAWQMDARRSLATRPDDAGVFRFDDMPPGDYFLAVLADFEPAMLSTPDFFERAVANAVRITLGEGEQRQQSFEIGR